ncbi:MAG: hypothetical protein RLZZ630_712 [Bacteroidota bacterium]
MPIAMPAAMILFVVLGLWSCHESKIGFKFKLGYSFFGDGSITSEAKWRRRLLKSESSLVYFMEAPIILTKLESFKT